MLFLYYHVSSLESFSSNDIIYGTIDFGKSENIMYAVIDGGKRDENIKKLETTLGVSLERWPAVFTSHCPGELQRTHKKGERGITLAHATVLRNFMKRDDKDKIVIFEDDAYHENDENILGKMEEILSDASDDITFMGWCYDYLCTHAYVVTKEGAKKILDEIDECGVIDRQYEARCKSGTLTCNKIDEKLYEGTRQSWTAGLFHQIGESMNI